MRWFIASLVCLMLACIGCGERRGTGPHVLSPEPPASDEVSQPEPVATESTSEQAPDEPGLGTESDAPELREVFEHVRVDTTNRIVEFDGIVPIDCHHEDSPEVYLEVIACTKGTREHEALVMTEARPSHVHAAMLLAGMVPGSPGSPEARGEASVSPTGARVLVEIEYVNEAGETITAPASAWIRHVETGARFDAASWVFAGSKIVDYRGREVYDADGTGLLISLAMFANARIEAVGMGGATLALEHGFSPEAGVAEPVWIADASVVPAYKTPVVVRLSAAERP